MILIEKKYIYIQNIHECTGCVISFLHFPHMFLACFQFPSFANISDAQAYGWTRTKTDDFGQIFPYNSIHQVIEEKPAPRNLHLPINIDKSPAQTSSCQSSECFPWSNHDLVTEVVQQFARGVCQAAFLTSGQSRLSLLEARPFQRENWQEATNNNMNH